MTEIVLRKQPGPYLIGATEHDKELVNKLKADEGITVKYSKKRNIGFHRKYFALLNLGFEAWEPEPVEHGGQVAEKNFDKFRKDIAILSGHSDLVISIKGEARVEAKSISFGNMEQDDFEDLYSKTIDILLKRTLLHYTEQEVRDVVDRILSFT